MIILKNQLNHQLKIVIRKNIAYCEIFFEMFIFSSHIYFKAVFNIARGVKNIAKNLNTAGTPT